MWILIDYLLPLSRLYTLIFSVFLSLSTAVSDSHIFLFHYILSLPQSIYSLSLSVPLSLPLSSLAPCADSDSCFGAALAQELKEPGVWRPQQQTAIGGIWRMRTRQMRKRRELRIKEEQERREETRNESEIANRSKLKILPIFPSKSRWIMNLESCDNVMSLEQ